MRLDVNAVSLDELLHFLFGIFVFSEWEWKMKLISDYSRRKLNLVTGICCFVLCGCCEIGLKMVRLK